MVRHAVKRKAPESDAKDPATIDYGFGETALIQFQNAEGQMIGSEIPVPLLATREDLLALLKAEVGDEIEEENMSLMISNYNSEITASVNEALKKASDDGFAVSTETAFCIKYFELMSYKVRPVARLAESLNGHNGIILCAQFSPNGQYLATASADCTVRLWDLFTCTPICSLQGHTGSITALAWSSCGRYVASGSQDKTVRVWDPNTQKCLSIMTHHRHMITSLAFMPSHFPASMWSSGVPQLASASKDGSIKLFDVVQGTLLGSLDGHTNMVTSIRWSGMLEGATDDDGKSFEGPYIYSSSRDMTIRLWSVPLRQPIRICKCHAHWVNTLTLNTDYSLRVGALLDPQSGKATREFNPQAMTDATLLIPKAQERFAKVIKNMGHERVAACSDDNTVTLYELLSSSKFVAKMTGHQKAVCDVKFSPDGRWLVTAGFDSSIRLWDGHTGKFIHTYRGHVSSVYQLAWSSDSRLFVSASKDSTLKLWNVVRRKLAFDLPGHADEIYAIDWDPTGRYVASGGKDKVLRLWSH